MWDLLPLPDGAAGEGTAACDGVGCPAPDLAPVDPRGGDALPGDAAADGTPPDRVFQDGTLTDGPSLDQEVTDGTGEVGSDCGQLDVDRFPLLHDSQGAVGLRSDLPGMGQLDRCRLRLLQEYPLSDGKLAHQILEPGLLHHDGHDSRRVDDHTPSGP